ncbi:MAG: glycosyltransferase family 2 protein [Anaerolineales bacterium]|nr:glycosyltransferase family 2 protein [Anaerolineales bacterium]
MAFLSIIIPAYNEEQRLADSLDKILAFLSRQKFTAEIIVVENGSCDRTAEIAQLYETRFPEVHLIQETRAGKGLAVRRGILAASGTYRFICDADLSMPIEQVTRFLPPVCKNYDIAIGSREVPGAMRYNEPESRHLIGRIYSLLVRLIALPGLQDTQCGFKCFHQTIVEPLFSVQQLDGWAFDVELLYIAQKRGMNIIEIPIDWYYRPGSRIRILRDSVNMFSDLFAIRRNWRQGKYEPSETSLIPNSED